MPATATKRRRRSAAERRLPSERTGHERGVDFYRAGEGWFYRDKGGKVHRRSSPAGEAARARDRGEPVDGRGKARAFASRATRSAGLEARRTGQQVGRVAYGTARAADVEPVSIGRLILYMGATLLGLALLDAALSGRGPAGVSKLLGLAGGAVRRLIDPGDPLIGHGAPTGPTFLPAPADASEVTDAGVAIPGSSSAVAQLDPWKAPKLKPPASVFGSPLAVVDRRRTQAGKTVELNERVVGTAEAIARHFNVKISSGYRSPEHNAEVGGAEHSDHLDGFAADFVGTPAAMKRLYAWAVKQGFPYVEPLAQAGDHVHISFLRGGKR